MFKLWFISFSIAFISLFTMINANLDNLVLSSTAIMLIFLTLRNFVLLYTIFIYKEKVLNLYLVALILWMLLIPVQDYLNTLEISNKELINSLPSLINIAFIVVLLYYLVNRFKILLEKYHN